MKEAGSAEQFRLFQQEIVRQERRSRSSSATSSSLGLVVFYCNVELEGFPIFSFHFVFHLTEKATFCTITTLRHKSHDVFGTPSAHYLRYTTHVRPGGRYRYSVYCL
jgi:hypothetical protein